MLQLSYASRATRMLYTGMQGYQGHKESLQNLPELLGLKLLGELSVLEVRYFVVPSPPQSHPSWLSHHHPGAQRPHLYPGPPAAQSGETKSQELGSLTVIPVIQSENKGPSPPEYFPTSVTMPKSSLYQNTLI